MEIISKWISKIKAMRRWGATDWMWPGYNGFSNTDSVQQLRTPWEIYSVTRHLHHRVLSSYVLCLCKKHHNRIIFQFWHSFNDRNFLLSFSVVFLSYLRSQRYVHGAVCTKRRIWKHGFNTLHSPEQRCSHYIHTCYNSTLCYIT